MHNRSATAAARSAFTADLVTLIKAVRDKSAGSPYTPDLLMYARRLDARMHQLAVAAHPWGAALTGLDSATVARRLSAYTAITMRARALAAAAALDTSLPDPDLAGRLAISLRRLTGDDPIGAGVPVRPAGTPSGVSASAGTRGRTRPLIAWADELTQALERLHPADHPADKAAA